MAAIRLKGHEKFHLRVGWIAKGLYGVSANPRVFSGSDGTDQLGVGTNMVKSIKYFRDEIILYELGNIFEEESSIGIDYVAELAANIYHLSRVAINTILDRLDNAGYITVNRTAGLDEIYPNKKISVKKIIEDYYTR